MVRRPLLEQSMLPSRRSQVHSSGHTHGAAAAESAAANQTSVQHLVLDSNGIFRSADPEKTRGFGVYVRQKRDAALQLTKGLCVVSCMRTFDSYVVGLMTKYCVVTFVAYLRIRSC